MTRPPYLTRCEWELTKTSTRTSSLLTWRLISSLIKWKRTMLIQEKGTIQGGVWLSSCTTQKPPGAVTHATRRPATVQAPLTNRTFLTTSRSLGYHSKSIAREEGRGRGGRGQGKGQQTGIRERKKPGVKQVSAERLRDGSKEWKLVF